MLDIKFQRKELLPGINVIRIANRDAIVGYTIYFDGEQAWTWIRKDRRSNQFYKTEQEAVEALATYTTLEKNDMFAKQRGVFENDKYVLGRNDENESKL